MSRPWLKSYDPWVQADLPPSQDTLLDLVDRVFEAFPNRAAWHFLGTTRTFGQLREDSCRFAHFLAEAGCGPGDVVGIHLPNTPQYIIAALGALRAGCVVTGVSPLLSATEMAHQLVDSGTKVLVTLDAAYEQRFVQVHEKLPDLTHTVVTGIADFLPPHKRFLGKLTKKIPTGKTLPVPGKKLVFFMDLLQKHPPKAPELQIGPDGLAFIQYTGGTTGLPKGAELTHANSVANHEHFAHWTRTACGEDVSCSGFPFFHVAGLSFCIGSLGLGTTQIIIPNPRDTKFICQQIARYQPTFLVNVPSLFQMLLAEPAFHTIDFAAIEGFNFCLSAAAPLVAESYRALEQVVGEGRVVELYGMTETSPVLTLNPTKGKKKIGSVGLPGPRTMVKLVDLETGTREVPLGQEGEIIAKGPQVMRGYHNKPEETEKVLRELEGETWIYTGDVGRMDEDGYLFLVDRAKDMIIVGGYKVFSREAEEKLYEHPAVEYCAFVGLPNPDRPGSELVKAVIQPTQAAQAQDPDELEQEIITFCRRCMAPYKVPKIIEFVEAIPLTPIGKVDKKALR